MSSELLKELWKAMDVGGARHVLRLCFTNRTELGKPLCNVKKASASCFQFLVAGLGSVRSFIPFPLAMTAFQGRVSRVQLPSGISGMTTVTSSRKRFENTEHIFSSSHSKVHQGLLLYWPFSSGDYTIDPRLY